MIVSRQNQRIKDIRRLKRSKDDRTILEGPHLVGAALERQIDLEFALATPAFLEDAEGSRLAESLGTDVLEVDPAILKTVCDADSPRGIVAVCSLPRGGAEMLPVPTRGLYLYVDGIQDPGNLGALIRSAEAFGVCGVAVSAESVHPNHPRALRASAGSLLSLPVAVAVDRESVDARLANLNPMWIALVPREGVAPGTIDCTTTCVLAVGAEGRGLSDEIVRHADLRVSISIDSRVESLNATVAAAIALYELSRER